MARPQFSIVTPSFRNSQWLRLCIASVADQGASLEHIVQDAGSDDGTLEWLPSDQRVRAFVEKDAGMYDAVNRGLRRAAGDFLAYLNCDEQYLPGSLAKVAEYFKDHPETEIVFANVVAIKNDGNFLCFRKVQVPSLAYTRASGLLSTLTCATFFRRSVLEKHDLWFNSHYRALGDSDWVVRALSKKIPMGVLREYTSAFTFTGSNTGLTPKSRQEQAAFKEAAPILLRSMRPLLVAHHRIRRLLDGAYHQDSFNYSIFTLSSPAQRQTFRVEQPTHRWPA